jgi:glucose-6-phosphate isomerase
MTLSTLPGPRTPVWADLRTHASRLSAVPTCELFERDPGRFERFSREAVGLPMDFSRQRLGEIVLGKLPEDPAGAHPAPAAIKKLLSRLAT